MDDSAILKKWIMLCEAEATNEPLQNYSEEEIIRIIDNTRKMSKPTSKRNSRAFKYIIDGLKLATRVESTISSIILNNEEEAIAIAVLYRSGYIARVASLEPGLGTIVMQDLIEKTRKAQIKRLFLKPNRDSVAFYRKFGFVQRRGFMFRIES